jgi:AcrR family transcriptional regulator
MPKIVDHEARRTEICAIAANLIAQGGLEAATIREIAQAAGYSKGVIEHYFDNKEEIVSGALEWANTCFQARADKLTEGLTGLDALRKRVEATLPLNKTVRDEWKVRLVFWSMAAIHSDLRKQQERRFNNAVAHFEADITAAVKAGELNSGIDASERARRIVNMVTGISTASLHNLSFYTQDFLLAEIENLVEQFFGDK